MLEVMCTTGVGVSVQCLLRCCGARPSGGAAAAVHPRLGPCSARQASDALGWHGGQIHCVGVWGGGAAGLSGLARHAARAGQGAGGSGGVSHTLRLAHRQAGGGPGQPRRPTLASQLLPGSPARSTPPPLRVGCRGLKVVPRAPCAVNARREVWLKQAAADRRRSDGALLGSQALPVVAGLALKLLPSAFFGRLDAHMRLVDLLWRHTHQADQCWAAAQQAEGGRGRGQVLRVPGVGCRQPAAGRRTAQGAYPSSTSTRCCGSLLGAD